MDIVFPKFKISINKRGFAYQQQVGSSVSIRNNFLSTEYIKDIAQLLGKSKVLFDTTTKQGQADAYNNCSIIQSIIDKQSAYLNSGKLELEDSTGKEVKSGIVYNQLKKLITNPNPLQTWDELENSINAYIKIYGWAPLIKVYPANRYNGIPSALWCIDPLDCEYKLSGKIFNQYRIQDIIEYFTYKTTSLEPVKLEGDQLNNLWIINGRTMSVGKQDILTAQSPLYSLKDSINLFQTSVNVYATLLKQSIIGMISNRSKDTISSISIDDETKAELNEHLRDKFGVIEGKDNFIISNRDLFFQSMLTNVGNLNIPEGLKIATNEICNKLDFQLELLAREGVTFQNKNSAEKAQYQNNTIPNSKHIYSSLTSFFIPEGYNLYRCYDDLPILQEDEKAKAETNKINIDSGKILYDAGLITKNQYLDMCDEDMIVGGDVNINGEVLKPLINN